MGLQIYYVVALLALFEFRTKANMKRYVRFTRFIRRWSIIALSVYMYQFLDVFNNPTKKMDEQIIEVKDCEELTDKMQEEISKYLVELSKEPLSEENIVNVNAMMRIVHELESIGDSCYKLILLAQRTVDQANQARSTISFLPALFIERGCQNECYNTFILFSCFTSIVRPIAFKSFDIVISCL